LVLPLLVLPLSVLLLVLVPRRVVAPLPAVAPGFVWPRRRVFQVPPHVVLVTLALRNQGQYPRRLATVFAARYLQRHEHRMAEKPQSQHPWCKQSYESAWGQTRW
jgi:hypothetical protein